ncbi:myo-inositol-1 phosphatase [Trypanosoma grayi]|uniref:myo-inositol-1 phosphatase n=1 Tax=Trypanosoma grayi TaxID=71804 RepID=UPI0004F43DC5|nr:myo-inositol-1 phosphatase [Trypanosoma grayi]KEG12638.1 myo-inositol-1 phosphatase [Trypanosoma grayi]
MEEYDINLDEALGVAMNAARKAGAIMWEFYQYRRVAAAATAARLFKEGGSARNAEHDAEKALKLLDVQVKSSSTDLVTCYDKRCDEIITKILKKFNAKVEHEKSEAGFPSFKFNFITEEMSPDAPLTDAPTWIVDPIDGTMAFIHGACDCCVSIGLTIKKVTVLAVVFCPFLSAASNTPTGSVSSSGLMGEMYTAIRGRGAFLNGHQLNAWFDATPRSALVVLNYPTGARLSEEEQKAASADSNIDIDAVKQKKLQKVVEAAGHIRQRPTATSTLTRSSRRSSRRWSRQRGTFASDLRWNLCRDCAATVPVFSSSHRLLLVA